MCLLQAAGACGVASWQHFLHWVDQAWSLESAISSDFARLTDKTGREACMEAGEQLERWLDPFPADNFLQEFSFSSISNHTLKPLYLTIS